MKAPTLGTESPTSFMMVLNCASNREHAGAYLGEPESKWGQSASLAQERERERASS